MTIQYGFFIDLSRCIGCNSCTVSCKQWRDIPPGPAKPMRVHQWETGNFPNVRLHMLPVPCFHCEEPACMKACENKAIYKEEKYGAVLVEPNKCKGERKCWTACPYGSPQYENDEPGARMLKCNMCIDRLEEGLKPICVLSCSMRALEFGKWSEITEKYGGPGRQGAKPGFGPCRLTCPAGVDAEGYIALLREGKFREAIELFRDTSPFAGVLGRVCTHPCESECQRGKIDQSVSIRALKRYMADFELREGRRKGAPSAQIYKERIAIIGSGPAGLSCAYDLVRKGYPVTVLESSTMSGGMLRHCIPHYRLPNDIIENEIRFVEESGVEIRTGTTVERVRDIFAEGFRSIFIAIGAWESQKLEVQGEDGKGITYALDFLKRANSGEKIELGKKVAVIGGGSVAIDAARVALRLGAEEVHLICLETRDLECRDRMPSQDEEISEAEEEGVTIHPCLGVNRIMTQEGHVSALETVRCASVFDSDGKFDPVFCQGDYGVIPVDTVIVAIGQRVPMSFPELDRGPSGNIRTDEITLQTNLEGVFAGADVVSGPANVIRSIAHGKRAAVSIDRYLRGKGMKQGRSPSVHNFTYRTRVKSTAVPVLSVEERKGFREVAQGIDETMSKEQSERCLRCGMTMPCVVFKPMDSKSEVVPWDVGKALDLWQKRQSREGEPLPDVFFDRSAFTAVCTDIVGRNRLVLKPKDGEELLYYTTDDE